MLLKSIDNLPAHKIALIEPLIKAVGAKVFNLSPYSPDFNPIDCGGHNNRAFLRQFSPTTAIWVDTLIAFRGRQAPPNQYESRVVGLRRGEKIPSLLTTDFFVQKINLNSASRLW